MFGYYSYSFAEIGSSAISLFLKIVGKINYQEMVDANSAMAPAILFPFAVIFFFILLNMFVAIVMSNYSILRKKSQLKTEANARIAEEEGKEWSKKILNLVLCLPPNSKDDAEKGEDEANASIHSCCDNNRRRG